MLMSVHVVVLGRDWKWCRGVVPNSFRRERLGTRARACHQNRRGGGAISSDMRPSTERVLLFVFLGAIAGALVASWSARAASALESATGLGWIPDTLHRGDIKSVLEYRRDAIAAATEEWRATVSRLGYADEFGLDAGPFGRGAPKFANDEEGRSD